MRKNVQCTICKDVHVIEVDEKDYSNWKNGEVIQSAMPYLTPGERELLISSVCVGCFLDLTTE